MTPDVQTLDPLHKARREFSSCILRSEFKSYYGEENREIFKEYRNRAKYGTLFIYTEKDKIP